MSVYTPDAWVIVEIDSKTNGKIYKVLAGWYGGFAGANSWKISSGIESVEIDGAMISMPQSSGSIYRVRKGDERMSMLMADVLSSATEKAAQKGSGFTIRVIKMAELQTLISCAGGF